MRLLIREVLEATGGKLIFGDRNQAITGVSTDTRTLKRGDLFFALKGERFDGHAYVRSALKRGAAGVVVEKRGRTGQTRQTRRTEIQVPDTLKALGDLASYWRYRHPIPVIAITGSNGKTTTKEMLASILSRRYRVLKTEGNLNNQIGVPLTLFRLRSRHQMAVLEFGMNHPGEIRRLAEIGAPRYGLITNVGRAHLQGLGRVRGVARAKGELIEALPADGVSFLNRDDRFYSFLRDRSLSPVVSFGWGRGAEVRGGDLRMEGIRSLRFRVSLGGRSVPFSLSATGRHNGTNALAAIAVADHLGIPTRSIQEALTRFHPESSRMEVVKRKKWIVINDAYNANPDSMARALEFLAEMGRKEGRRTVAILGDMLELGRHARLAHREVGRKVADLGIQLLIAIGPHSREIVKGACPVGVSPSYHFRKLEEAKAALPSLLHTGDLILIKGSRGMQMERIKL